MEIPGLMEGKELEIPLLPRLGRTGELRLLAGDEGVKNFFGEEGTIGVRDGEDDVEGCDFPPSRKPLQIGRAHV